MKWTEITVQTSSEAVEAVSNILMELGSSGLSIEDAADYAKLKAGRYGDYGEIIDPTKLIHIESGAMISAYFPENINIREQVDLIREKVTALKQVGLNPGKAEVSIVAVDDKDWATEWEKYYHPVRITHFLTVVPQWEDYQIQSPHEQVIRLDPGMAFGTGTHPTTQLTLQALETVVMGGESMIDVGTGSGVLSIAAKLLGVDTIFATDLDEVAVESAQKNINLNPQATSIEVVANDLLNGINKHVDLVVANILAEIIVPLIPQAWHNLNDGGYFVTSGIIADKIDLILSEMKAQGFKIIQTSKMKDWYGVIAQKPNPDEG